MAEALMGGKVAADKIIFIYALVDPETGEKRYIGKTNDTGQRLRAHESEARYKRNRKSNWIRSLNKRGLRPIIEVLETAAIDSWIEAEVRWIAHGRSNGWPLLNVTDGGDDIPAEAHSPEARAKALETRKTSRKWIEAHAAASAKRRGSKLSEETKRKISEGNKGKTLSPEHIEKLRLAHVGRVYSPAFLSNAHRKGSKASEETRAKLRKARAAQREHLSECQRKNWQDPDYRAAMSAKFSKPKSEEERGRLATLLEKMRADPSVNEKRLANLRAAQSSREYRAARSAALKRLWSDPEFRAKMKAARFKP